MEKGRQGREWCAEERKGETKAEIVLPNAYHISTPFQFVCLLKGWHLSSLLTDVPLADFFVISYHWLRHVVPILSICHDFVPLLFPLLKVNGYGPSWLYGVATYKFMHTSFIMSSCLCSKEATIIICECFFFPTQLFPTSLSWHSQNIPILWCRPSFCSNRSSTVRILSAS